MTLGDSSKVMVGQKILALGNPFGLERTLTSGIVSSLDRSIKAKNGRMIKGIIQTDAAINPGNSGGPCSIRKGQVIGMNTAIVSQVGQSAGISFAVPINSISRILGQLDRERASHSGRPGDRQGLRHGRRITGHVDCRRRACRASRRSSHPRESRTDRPGFVRRTLDPDSADLIVAVDHKRVRTVEELLTEVEKHRPGETIRLTVVRDGKPTDIFVLLGQFVIIVSINRRVAISRAALGV